MLYPIDGQVRVTIHRLKLNLILISLYGERVFHGYLKGYGYQFIVHPLACCVCSSLFKVCLCNSRNFTFSTSTFWVSTSLDTYHRCFSMSNFAFKMAYVKRTEVQMSYRKEGLSAHRRVLLCAQYKMFCTTLPYALHVKTFGINAIILCRNLYTVSPCQFCTIINRL